MDRVVRLYQLWSWLPHFRAIAETEHLPTASEALGLSASALSRALKQLEAAVGCDLFARDGRAIRLNEAGEELLRAVRLAMRGIDDALTSLAEDTSPLRSGIAAPGPFHAALILDVVADIARRHPRVRAELSSVASDDLVGALCRGLIDLCLHEGAIEHPDLESRVLAEIPSGSPAGRVTRWQTPATSRSPTSPNTGSSRRRPTPGACARTAGPSASSAMSA